MVPRHLFSRLLARLLLPCSDGGSRGGAGLFFPEWGRGGAPDRKACVSCHPQRCRCSGLVRGGRTACLCVRAVRDVLKGTRSCCWTFFSPPSPRFVVSREGRRPDFPHPLQRALPPPPSLLSLVGREVGNCGPSLLRALTVLLGITVQH